MKSTRLIILIFMMTIFGCSSQSNVVDLSDHSDTSYLISNISECHFLSKEMFNGAFYINVFQIMDSKISPKNSNETEEVLSSFLISMIPDGDYYTESNLIKIPGFLNPKLLNIREKEYPKFEIIIEHGPFKKRKEEVFIIKANFNY